MKPEKTKTNTGDFQTLSIFLILGVLTIGFVLGLRWVFLAPGMRPLTPLVQQVAPIDSVSASKE